MRNEPEKREIDNLRTGKEWGMPIDIKGLLVSLFSVNPNFKDENLELQFY